MTRFCVGGITPDEWDGNLALSAGGTDVSVYRLEFCWNPAVAVNVQLFRYAEQASGGIPRQTFAFDDTATSAAGCLLQLPDNLLADHVSTATTGPGWNLDAQGHFDVDLETNPLVITAGHSLVVQIAPIADTFTIYYDEDT